jgi:hypothetical protein
MRISNLVRPFATVKGAAACLIAGILAAGAAPAAAQASSGNSISIATLEKQFWACDHAATNGLVDLGTAIACVVAMDQLKQRKFNGDFAAVLAWWQSNKAAEHLALDTAHRHATAQARSAGPR